MQFFHSGGCKITDEIFARAESLITAPVINDFFEHIKDVNKGTVILPHAHAETGRLGPAALYKYLPCITFMTPFRRKLFADMFHIVQKIVAAKKLNREAKQQQQQQQQQQQMDPIAHDNNNNTTTLNSQTIDGYDTINNNKLQRFKQLKALLMSFFRFFAVAGSGKSVAFGDLFHLLIPMGKKEGINIAFSMGSVTQDKWFIMQKTILML